VNTAADALLAFFPGSLAGDLRNTFGQMAIAEEEIDLARRRHPECSAYLNKVGFLLCMPSEVLLSAAEWIYRAHCREILERVADDRDPRPPSSAELAIAFSETSLKAPLNPTGAGLYARHFLRSAERVDQPLKPELVGALRKMDARLDPALAKPLEFEACRSLLQKERKPKMTLRQFERLAES
jgi:hypothetical protein